MRERLIKLLDVNCGYVEEVKAETLADYLLANGVVMLPCNYSPHINTMKPSCRNCLNFDGRGKKCTLKAQKSIKERNNAKP